MQRFAAAILFALARLAGRLPWRWHPWLVARIASLWLRTNARESRVALRNLELAFPDMPSAEREALRTQVLLSTARQWLDTLRFWTRPHGENLALIRTTEGEASFEAAIASGRGVIVAAPHHGNWELLNQWLAARSGAIVVFAWCERRPATDPGSPPSFVVHVEPAPADIASADLGIGVHALNDAIERIATRDPAQYQWTYKRYSRQARADPAVDANPYKR